ncbi:hypothetical protein [Paenibacillus riograndensis]|uniref:Uncharacterized protein n=1 Tax=Paenibacillus riograndensis SBR5 TaxID=1073571 RepID=A0A0E4HFI5_9BACL|nr:hypothetical protein [Paenibacillus riograndensis]CQR58421.1 hypothetical protein PRIO_6052 [Paenibacillus riograndensis SBR5]
MNTNEVSDTAFSTKQIVNSLHFSPGEKDVLNVILLEDQSYTLEEAREQLKSFLNKEVI